jgi:hypothetical protein
VYVSGGSSAASLQYSSITDGSTTVSAGNVNGLAIGMNVSGAGIRPGTRIAAISGNTVTLTKPALGFTSGNVILTATPYAPTAATGDFTGGVVAEAGATNPVSLNLNTILGGSSGLTGAKTWSLSAGQTLPWWIGITSTGTLSAQAPASELSSILPVRVQVTDAGGAKKLTGAIGKDRIVMPPPFAF